MPSAPSAARASWIFHLLLEGSIVLLVIAAAFWFLEPTAGSYTSLATATLTRTPWPSATYTDTPTPTVTATVTPTPTETPFCVHHVVERSESLEIIAEKFRVSVPDIRQRNLLSEAAAIQPGQELCIPISPAAVPSLTPLPTNTPTPFAYAVQEGDNLASIAHKFNTTVELLVKANDLSEGELLPLGRELTIIQIFPTPTPVTPTLTATPTPLAPTRTPTVTETPRAFAYQPPTLLSPLPGSTFRGRDVPIVLSWTAVTLLAPEEWYLLRVFRIEGSETHTIANVRTKGTCWRMPASAYPVASATPQPFAWDVITVREAATGELIAVSPSSVRGHFAWY